MAEVRCYLRKRGYRVDEGWVTLLDDDEEKARKHLGKQFGSAIRAENEDPDERGHLFSLEVRAGNGDYLYDLRWPVP